MSVLELTLHLPKGATVISFLYGIHHDPEFYDDPKVFRPSRFIDSSGGFVRDDRVMPFGIGKRSCLGQSLAEKEFFLFFAALVQHFRFLPDPATALPSYSEIYPKSVIRVAPAYNVILERRLL
jgi:cytochrome P450